MDRRIAASLAWLTLAACGAHGASAPSPDAPGNSDSPAASSDDTTASTPGGDGMAASSGDDAGTSHAARW